MSIASSSAIGPLEASLLATSDAAHDSSSSSLQTKYDSSVEGSFSSRSRLSNGENKKSEIGGRGRSGFLSRRKYRILMLISDTGGGHRASADALAAAIHELYPNLCEIEILDLWTNYGVFPFNVFVPAYKYLCDNPSYWKMLYVSTQSKLSRKLINTSGYVLCGHNIRMLFEQMNPDIICSLHPMCQHVPLKILDEINSLHQISSETPNDSSISVTKYSSLPSAKRRFSDGQLQSNSEKEFSTQGIHHYNQISSKKRKKRIPFVTVVTDLGGAHPTWFSPEVDLCFVPSQRVRELALSEGLEEKQIRLYGLPLRKAFWTPETRSKAEIKKTLGLDPDPPMSLVIGGGDGVGGLTSLTTELVTSMSELQDQKVQIVVICGRNEATMRELEEKFHGITRSKQSTSKEDWKDQLKTTTTTNLTSPRRLEKQRNSFPEATTTKLDDGATTGRYEMRRSASFPPPSSGRLNLSSFTDVISSPSNKRVQESLEALESSSSSPSPRFFDRNALPPTSDMMKKTYHKLEALNQHPSALLSPSSTSYHQLVSETPMKRRFHSNLKSYDEHVVSHLHENRKVLQRRIHQKTEEEEGITNRWLNWFLPSSQSLGSSKVEQNRKRQKGGWTSTIFWDDQIDESSSDGEHQTNKFKNVSLLLKGFVMNVSDWMGAADFIITKAGPGTISEACSRGLPVLLFCYLPGQEEGNVEFVVYHQFGGYSPVAHKIATVAKSLITNPLKCQSIGERGRCVFDPQATCKIATDIVELMKNRVFENEDM